MDDPIKTRERMEADYRAVADRNGVTPSGAEIEKLAIHDLEQCDAVERTAKPVQRRKPEAPSNRADDLAESLGWETYRREIPDTRMTAKSFLQSPPKNQKQAAAIMRLGKILQPASTFRPSKEFDYRIPRLAQEFAQLMIDLERGSDEFRGKSAQDTERITWRRIEDICDKSTASLGPWWVR